MVGSGDAVALKKVGRPGYGGGAVRNILSRQHKLEASCQVWYWATILLVGNNTAPPIANKGFSGLAPASGGGVEENLKKVDRTFPLLAGTANWATPPLHCRGSQTKTADAQLQLKGLDGNSEYAVCTWTIANFVKYLPMHTLTSLFITNRSIKTIMITSAG